ncbi:glutathione S-transferase family protein [Motilimonas eburnea]|uniref:glutathione S-transferase family protein n=1 Tax=Motilimonas eburnea TaxID=1737488 RepID=UPI001E5FC350|nr:glutathione S-transferase family protein [Motilimonas eburnea]MCE2572793.1 glutathione S-transferase family protein [Motilimonas eburnea]
MLVNGVWQQKWQPVQDQDKQGRFIRQTSSFRNWITRDGAAGITGQGGYPAQAGRYHLYVAYICPWASRTLMARALKGLQEIISVSVVSPKLTDQGWKFAGLGSNGQDELSHKTYLHELYSQVAPDFTGRATVPVLWDKETHTIVNNESADIVRMFNSAFVELVDQGPDLVPAGLMAEIDALNDFLYTHLNNGVYQAGFATSQAAYEEAYEKVFTALDTLEQRLSDGRSFLFGDALTESDLRLFVTLIRFDLAYYGLFKCNRNMIKDMPVLHNYMLRVLAIKGIAGTVNIDHIKQGYYSIKALNPNGIVPKGPAAIFQ